MEYKLIIPGRMPDLNDYLRGERIPVRRNGRCTTQGNALKQDSQKIVISNVRKQLLGVHINKGVEIDYMFYEPNMKRDLDNISSFAHKVIQDGLVKGGTLEDDGWKNIKGYSDKFYLDSENPRIEITIREVE